MITNKSGAFILGLLIGVGSTWLKPYSDIEFMGVDYRMLMALAALLLSFLYRLYTRAKTFNTGLLVGLGIVLALILRIIMDSVTARDSHTIWALEIAIFVVIAFPSAFIGSYLGELLQLGNKKRRDQKETPP